MKNVIKFLAVVIFMATATVQAQDKPACCVKKAEKKIEKMKEMFSLSDDQVAQVTVLFKEGGDDFAEKIKEVLTPEQYSQFQEIFKGKSCDAKKTEKKSCCKKEGDKKACDSKVVEGKSCDAKSTAKKSCCKKGADKKSCDSKKAEKKSCKKDGEKKSCCKKKA